jgi:hypothetical protein
MKTAIIKDVKNGAITGLALAIFYTIIVLIITEIALPLSTPPDVVIFTANSILPIIEALTIASPIWLFAPMLIGFETAWFFKFVLIKLDLPKNVFLLICFLFCLAITFFIYLPFKDLLLFQLGFSDISLGASKYFMLFNPSFGFMLMIMPGVIYLVTGLIIGNKRYDKFISS